MTFKNWMSRNYRYSLNDKGDLAHHIRTDEKFPQNGKGKFDGWRDLIREYLEEHGADYARLRTFDICWKEYEQCERAKLRGYSCKR